MVTSKSIKVAQSPVIPAQNSESRKTVGYSAMDDTAKPSLKLELGLYILLLKVSKHLQIRPLVTFKPHSLKLLLDLLLAVEPDSETPVFVPSHHQITELLKHESKLSCRSRIEHTV